MPDLLIPDSDAQRLRLLSDLVDLTMDERSAYLATHVEDADLRREIENRLALADEEADEPLFGVEEEEKLELFASALADQASEKPPLFKPGDVVGRYEVGYLLGVGGYGEVYTAMDTEAEKQVALKVLRVTDERVRLRLQREYRLLARLDHPGIVRYMAPGEADDGTPFYVMEYVEGKPITDYCDERRLPISERIQLLIRLCDAVQHAHENLIVHRDLKPGNVFVTEEGEIKIVDFGIGKAVDEAEEELADTRGELSSEPLATSTQTRNRRLTPAYAAPEQFRGDPPTPATDVYSLGVICYEVLAGERPYDLTGLSLAEMVTRLEGIAPPKMSETAASVGTENILIGRSTTKRRLVQRLTGDLDAMTKKALSFNSAHRYAQAGGLGMDFQRHVDHKPVSARNRTTAYRTGRFARRHWIPIFVLLGLIVSAGYAFDRVVDARAEAEREARRASASVEFLGNILSAANPENAEEGVRLDTLNAIELLNRGTARIGAELNDQPELQAYLWDVVGDVYIRLGRYAEADSILTIALLQQRKIGQPVDLASILDNLGTVHQRLGEHAEAETFFVEALEIRTRELKPGDALYSLVGESHNNYAIFLGEATRPAEALVHMEAAERVYRSLPAVDSMDLMKLVNNKGYILDRLGRFEEAQEAFGEALEWRERTLGVHSLVGESYANMAWNFRRMGEYERALDMMREAIRIDSATLGIDHEYVAQDFDLLGQAFRLVGRYDSSVVALERALESREQILGSGHPDVAITLNNLGIVYQDLDRLDEAEQVLSRAYQIGQEAPASPGIRASTQLIMGTLAEKTGRLVDAEQFFRRALAMRIESYGDEHVHVQASRLDLAELLVKREKYEEALALAREAFLIIRRDQGPDGEFLVRADTLVRNLERIQRE